MKTLGKFSYVFALSLILFFVAPLALSAKTMYVKRSGTKLMSEASSKSKVMEKLGKGTAVDVSEKSGKYYKVTAGGSSGWIFKFKLSSKAPAGASGDADLLGELGGRQQVAARETGSSSSIRGLSPVSEELAHKKGIPEDSINAVRSMENYKLPEGDLDRFLQQGQLGEYAQ